MTPVWLLRLSLETSKGVGDVRSSGGGTPKGCPPLLSGHLDTLPCSPCTGCQVFVRLGCDDVASREVGGYPSSGTALGRA